MIGAGVFGAWTAWHLRQAGASVRLIDAWGPAHSRASSGGESRIIRMGYGADEIYTRLAVRSLELWKAHFPDYFHATGVLWMAREDDARSDATTAALARHGVAAQVLDASAMRARYPQMRLPEGTFGILEPASGALMARRAVNAVVRDALRLGVEWQTAWVAAPPPAGIHVYACGPWMGKVFPDLLSRLIVSTRQEMFFFAPPPGDPRFAPAALPVWLDFTDPRRPYGVPDLEGRGIKLAFDRYGPAFDPDTGSRVVTAEGIAEARQFLADRFPALAGAPLTESRVCQYENTPDGDFLIDRHPAFDNLWLVAGGSGHGFKHGPAVGEYAAARILGTGEAEPRFALASKKAAQSRKVH